MHKQQGPGDQITMKGTFDGLYFGCLCHSTALSVPMRRGYGREALGMNGFGAMVILLVAWGADTTGIMMMYFWLWFCALLFQRLITVANRKKGIIPHSRYSGWPYVAMAFPGVKRESQAKGIVEPLICLVVGVALFSVSEVAGAFFIVGMFSMAVVEGTHRRFDEVRVQQMRDAEMEAQHTASMYRGEDNY